MNQIEDIICVVEGVNPFGKVSSGILKVRGRLTLARDVRTLFNEDNLLKSNSYVVEDRSNTLDYAEDDLDVDGWQPEYAYGQTYGLQVVLPGTALILQRLEGENGKIGADSKFRRIGLVQLYKGLRNPFKSIEEATSLSII
ncbi:hypothetical protein NHQ30_005773 [Ciborinia camelliae]|nr:hypothetical protein NHQ30_005773 [Ciborinia camelliae]